MQATKREVAELLKDLLGSVDYAYQQQTLRNVRQREELTKTFELLKALKYQQIHAMLQPPQSDLSHDERVALQRKTLALKLQANRFLQTLQASRLNRIARSFSHVLSIIMANEQLQEHDIEHLEDEIYHLSQLEPADEIKTQQESEQALQQQLQIPPAVAFELQHHPEHLEALTETIEKTHQQQLVYEQKLTAELKQVFHLYKNYWDAYSPVKHPEISEDLLHQNQNEIAFALKHKINEFLALLQFGHEMQMEICFVHVLAATLANEYIAKEELEKIDAEIYRVSHQPKPIESSKNITFERKYKPAYEMDRYAPEPEPPKERAELEPWLRRMLNLTPFNPPHP